MNRLASVLAPLEQMSRSVQLEDPPCWPGQRVWRGPSPGWKVIAALGASHVDVGDARSVGDGVLARSYGRHRRSRATAVLRRDRDRRQ